MIFHDEAMVIMIQAMKINVLVFYMAADARKNGIKLVKYPQFALIQLKVPLQYIQSQCHYEKY